jgi:hypothetical protein
MLEILEFYVSSFWIWAGITYGIGVIGGLAIKLIAVTIVAINGDDITIN